MRSSRAKQPSGRRLIAAAFAVLFLAPIPSRAAPSRGFVVIVDASNPTRQIDRDDLSHLFLKKVTSWGDGSPVLPVDMPASAPVRAAFSSEVLSRNVNAVRAFWQQRIFSGRDLPPPVKTTAEEVIRFVRENPGAIGYVPAGVELGPGVRAVEILGGGR